MYPRSTLYTVTLTYADRSHHSKSFHAPVNGLNFLRAHPDAVDVDDAKVDIYRDGRLRGRDITVDDLGATPLFRRSARALGLLERNPGLVIAAPVPNCIFIQDHGGRLGHTGFVLSIDADDAGLLHTLEGNSDAAGSRTGGSVVLRTRRVDECRAFLEVR